MGCDPLTDQAACSDKSFDHARQTLCGFVYLLSTHGTGPGTSSMDHPRWLSTPSLFSPPNSLRFLSSFFITFERASSYEEISARKTNSPGWGSGAKSMKISGSLSASI